MANRFHDLIGQSRQTPPKSQPPSKKRSFPVKSVGWAGLPGKSQGKDRGKGTSKSSFTAFGGFHTDGSKGL